MSNRTTSLHRPEEGRWLAGVAAGLALRLGVSVWLVRIVFALLCFAGGLGALLYVASWLLIPREGETDSIVQGWMDTGQAPRWAGVILVGLAVIIVGSATGLIGGELAFAVVLIGIGVMLYRGDLGLGRRRSHTGRSTDPKEPPEPAADEPAAPEPAADEPAAEAAALAPAVAPEAAPPKERSYLSTACVGVAAIALGVLGLFDEIVVGFNPGFHHYMALAVGVIGIGVVVGAWFGRPAGLVILGVLLLPILLFSRLAAEGGVDLLSIEFSSVGDVRYRPGSVEEIREAYELEMGGLTIDLRDVDFEGRTVSVETEVGVGEVLVRIPEDVAVDVNGRVGMGNLQVGDWERGGVGIEADLRLEGSAGTLLLDSQVGIGEIEVRAWPGDDRSPHRISDEEALHREYRIRHGADLQGHYTLASGSLQLDLGELVLEEDRRVPITVGRGDVSVTVPPDTSLHITTRVDRGRLTVFEDVWEGSNLNSTHLTQFLGAPRLTLDIRLGAGSLTVEEK